MRSLIYPIGLLFIIMAMVSCHPSTPVAPPEEEIVADTLVAADTLVTMADTLTATERIEERGALVALICCPELNYHLHDGHPAGFQFELLDDFSEFLGVNLELRVIEDSLHHWQTHIDADLYAGAVDTVMPDSTCRYVFFDLPVATEQTFAWVIPNCDNDTTLLTAITLWLEDYQGSDMRRCFFCYFNGKGKTVPSAEDYICKFDTLIRFEAKRIGWDWRMLASIIYQESHFKPHLVNEKGAFGLMQLMPVTMTKYGIDYDSPIEEQLEVAGKLLQHFDRQLPPSISDSLERGNFILACYNAGMGHILEARLRAEKHGKDPDLWFDNVELYTPKQTYFFVREITKRYSHYKNLIE